MEKEHNRIILHSDLNNFFASVETALNPDLKGKAIAVCGSVEERHGIVLAKSELAKKYGVKTAMTINDAIKLCPQLVLVESKHHIYEEYSRKVRKIYDRFTDRTEPFGIDESWLDVTHSGVFGSGVKIADEIRETVKKELNLTCSVGVSFNKVFAKLGSDLKKPDATTVISPENYRDKVWPLPVGDLLYVGKSTAEKLKKFNIFTIGDLALTSRDFLHSKLGKWGESLWIYANGLDDSPVKKASEEDDIKSIGNSVTTYRNMENITDVKAVLLSLCESVSERLIRYGSGKASTVTLSVRDEKLNWITRQCKLSYPSVLSKDFFDTALELFVKNYSWKSFVRSIGVAVSDFIEDGEQLTFENNLDSYNKRVKLEKSVFELRKKYGDKSLRKGIMLCDDLSVESDNTHEGGLTKSGRIPGITKDEEDTE